MHFCYVSEELKDLFDEQVNVLGHPANYWIGRWAIEDFEMINITTVEELDELKSLIRKQYQDMYPELYLDSIIDRQGWLRVWFTKHMEKELANIEE